MRLCIVTFNQSTGAALSVRIKHSGVSDFSCCTDFSELNYSSFDYVVFTGFLPSIICRKLNIPKQVGNRELINAVQYKFVNNLPVDPSDVWWEYRIMNSGETKNEYKICAIAINREEFAKQTAILAHNNIKIDHCIPSTMLITEDIFPGIDKLGAPTLENFSRYIQETQAEKYADFVKKIGPDISDSSKLACFALLSYAKQPKHIASIVSCKEMIPSDLHPVRYKFLRRINLVLMIFGIIFASVALAERSSRSYGHYEKVESENDKLREELKKLQGHNLRLAESEKLLKEYRDLKVGYTTFEEVLLELTQKIPSHMWVKSLRLSNDRLDLIIESSKDDINFYNTVKSGTLYDLKSLRKNKIRDDNFDYAVSLELISK